MAEELPTNGEGGGVPAPRKRKGSRKCMPSRPLLPRQELFVHHYLATFNATQAAILAGYSIANADKIGSEILGNPRVKRVVHEKLAVMTTRLQITADEVLREIWLIAKSNIADYRVNERGELMLASDLTDPGVARAVQSVKHRTRVIRRYREDGVECEIAEYETEIKLYDKLRALITAAQYLGILRCPLPSKESDVINELLELLDRSSPDLAAEIRRSLNSAVEGRGLTDQSAGGSEPEGNGPREVPG